LPKDSKTALPQQIQLQVEKLQADIVKQRSNVINARNAIARSDVAWTKEMGIDDPDLIHSLRISVKNRLERYEKRLAELEKQLDESKKQLIELNGGLERDPSEHEELSTIVDVKITYDDSFCDIIKAVKAVAHLVYFSPPKPCQYC
jgi:flagellar motility protein MotE (MotC chaperone)